MEAGLLGDLKLCPSAFAVHADGAVGLNKRQPSLIISDIDGNSGFFLCKHNRHMRLMSAFIHTNIHPSTVSLFVSKRLNLSFSVFKASLNSGGKKSLLCVSQLNVTFAPVPCSVKERRRSWKRAVAAPRLTAAAYPRPRPPPTPPTTSLTHTSELKRTQQQREKPEAMRGKKRDKRDEMGG